MSLTQNGRVLWVLTVAPLTKTQHQRKRRRIMARGKKTTGKAALAAKRKRASASKTTTPTGRLAKPRGLSPEANDYIAALQARHKSQVEGLRAELKSEREISRHARADAKAGYHSFGSLLHSLIKMVERHQK